MYKRQREYLQKKNIQVLHAASQTQDATVFDISDKGFANVSNTFPDIPVVDEKWYQEDGYWKYRLTDGEMAIGWREIGGDVYKRQYQGLSYRKCWCFKC